MTEMKDRSCWLRPPVELDSILQGYASFFLMHTSRKVHGLRKCLACRNLEAHRRVQHKNTSYLTHLASTVLRSTLRGWLHAVGCAGYGCFCRTKGVCVECTGAWDSLRRSIDRSIDHNGTTEKELIDPKAPPTVTSTPRSCRFL